ncbi:hypothetical protein QD712_29785 [Streptomyces acidiscabies]|uniref:hypothetical protein n=1 Tax=Streptomyces acidiscabies TaxID=42234 RepID=UPI0030CD8690
MTIGTVIGVVSAIGSLLFTGIATYYGAVIAQQQVDQSRDDSEKDARSQAERVTFWIEEDFATEDRALHLVNRSLDAVTEGDVLLNTTYKGKGYELILPDISLPPCAEAIFKNAEMGALIARNAVGQVDLKDTGWDVGLFGFTDNAGQRWVRSPSFLKHPEKAQEALLEAKTDGLVRAAGPIKTTALNECGSDK